MLFVVGLFVQCISDGCQNHPGRKVSDKELFDIKESYSLKKYPVELYCLDGNCSFCLAKAKEFDEQRSGKGMGSIILFKTANPVMTSLYIRDVSLKSCVILDSTYAFAKSFALNTVYTISEKGEILSEKSDQ